MLPVRAPLLSLLAFVCFVVVALPIVATPAVPVLQLHDIGRGSAPLNGPWQFHTGDDPSWANPAFDDGQWEQIKVNAPWGVQGRASYWGFAWYRKHIDLAPAQVASPDVAKLIPWRIEIEAMGFGQDVDITVLTLQRG